MIPNAPISQGKLMPASGRGNSVELALEVSELRYRRLFETAQDGILILDADSGKIIDVNPFLLDLLDYPFESIIGLQLWEIGLFEDIAANQAAFEKLQTRSTSGTKTSRSARRPGNRSKSSLSVTFTLSAQPK